MGMPVSRRWRRRPARYLIIIGTPANVTATAEELLHPVIYFSCQRRRRLQTTGKAPRLAGIYGESHPTAGESNAPPNWGGAKVAVLVGAADSDVARASTLPDQAALRPPR